MHAYTDYFIHNLCFEGEGMIWMRADLAWWLWKPRDKSFNEKNFFWAWRGAHYILKKDMEMSRVGLYEFEKEIDIKKREIVDQENSFKIERCEGII